MAVCPLLRIGRRWQQKRAAGRRPPTVQKSAISRKAMTQKLMMKLVPNQPQKM